jgi:hypothetical protein
MKYKVHRLNINLAKEPEMLENFLNNLKGEVVSIIPDVKPLFLYFGSRVRSIVVIEKVER